MWEMLTFDVPYGNGNPWTVRPLASPGCAECCCTSTACGPGQQQLAVEQATHNAHLPHFNCHTLLQLVSHVLSGGRLDLPTVEALPGGSSPALQAGLPGYVALMKRCWAQAPEQRPTFDDIVQELR